MGRNDLWSFLAPRPPANTLPRLLPLLCLVAAPLLAEPAAAQPTTPWGQGAPRRGAASPSPSDRPSVRAIRPQASRPASIARELQRAEMAFRSGASLLEAKARLDRILADRPTDVDALRLRAHVLLAQNRAADALADALAADRLAPGDPEVLLLVTEAARRSGDRVRADDALDRAARLAVRDAPLHVRLSWNAAELGDLDRAEAFARIAVQQGPSLPSATLQLARVLVLQRQDDAAAAVLARGATRGLLSRRTVQDDDLLRRLIDHPDLRRVLR